METAIFTLIGTVIGFSCSLFATFKKSKDTELDVRTKVVTNERAQWRKDMRELASSFIALSSRISKGNATDDDTFNLEKTRVAIKLRLNPSDEHNFDKDILELLPIIAELAISNKAVELKEKQEKLEKHMQKLIKREWDKSKKEAESGNIAKSDKNNP